MTEETSSSSEEENDFLLRNRRRFGGYRYQLQAPDTYGPSDIVPERVGKVTYPDPNGKEQLPRL
jgi:hypothetical protein